MQGNFFRKLDLDERMKVKRTVQGGLQSGELSNGQNGQSEANSIKVLEL